MEIIAREAAIPEEKITKSGGDSYMVAGKRAGRCDHGAQDRHRHHRRRPRGPGAALSARERAPEASVLILERDRALGGILQQCIHNGFGLHYFGEELTGPEYVDRFIRRLEGKNIEVWLDTMVLEIGEGRPRGLRQRRARPWWRSTPAQWCLAMGCRERPRGALIPGTRPAGVYTAGTAQRLNNIDGYLPGKRIVILGSGRHRPDHGPAHDLGGREGGTGGGDHALFQRS